MTSGSNSKASRTLPRILLAFAIAFGSLIIVVVLNIDKIGLVVEDIVKGNFGSGPYLAKYDDFRLTASSKAFFKFSSGRGQNLLANVRVQFIDGSVFALPQLTPDDVQRYYPDANQSVLKELDKDIIRYRIGFDSFEFVGAKLHGVTLSEDSQIAIDFGDGQFVKLPVERKKLLKLLGPPNEWEKVRGGPP